MQGFTGWGNRPQRATDTPWPIGPAGASPTRSRASRAAGRRPDPPPLFGDLAVPEFVVGLGSPHSLNSGIVGNGAALLATAKHRRLPVADGIVMTIAGVIADDSLCALRGAWPAVRGPVRITLSDLGPYSCSGSGPARCDASTWLGLLDGLSEVLLHDIVENPSRCDRLWGIVIVRLPPRGRRALAEVGPDGHVTVWDQEPGLTPRSRRELRELAESAHRRLGRPLALEAVATADRGWVIVDLRPPVPLPRGR